MNTDKIDPSKKDTTISSTDDLVKPANAELSEEELKRVSGGVTSGAPLKVRLGDIKGESQDDKYPSNIEP
jgi:bacteriocin-like protein